MFSNIIYNYFILLTLTLIFNLYKTIYTSIILYKYVYPNNVVNQGGVILSKNCCNQKNKKTTTLKSDPKGPNYQEGVKNKANEHTPTGEKEPSTHTTFK